MLDKTTVIQGKIMDEKDKDQPEVVEHGIDWVLQGRAPTCPECGFVTGTAYGKLGDICNGMYGRYYRPGKKVTFDCAACSCKYEYSRTE
jgi:hypothetical protein